MDSTFQREFAFDMLRSMLDMRRLFAAILLFCSACAPSLISRAQDSLEAAAAVQAQQHAPYEYAAASAYLEKAEDASGEASKQFAKKSLEYSAQAKKRALALSSQ